MRKRQTLYKSQLTKAISTHFKSFGGSSKGLVLKRGLAKEPLKSTQKHRAKSAELTKEDRTKVRAKAAAHGHKRTVSKVFIKSL